MNSTAGILSVQFNPKCGDKKYNLEKAYSIIEQYCDKQLDLVVLPEFFTTSLDEKTMIDSPEDSNGGKVVEFMSKVAKRFNTNIVCGSVMEKDGENLFNTAFILNRHGDIIAKYRKIHLYDYFGGNEGTYTTPGKDPIVVQMDFGKVGVSMCFDINFPMLYKELIKSGAEIIVSPSAWSTLISDSDKDKQIFVETWRALNITRAVENLIYFVTSNLVGKTNPYICSCGNSMIINPFGKVLNAFEEEGGIYSLVDLEIVRELKKTVPIPLLD